MTNKLDYYYRIDGKGFPIAGTLQSFATKPTTGTWKQLPQNNICCPPNPNSDCCYTTVTYGIESHNTCLEGSDDIFVNDVPFLSVGVNGGGQPTFTNGVLTVKHGDVVKFRANSGINCVFTGILNITESGDGVLDTAAFATTREFSFIIDCQQTYEAFMFISFEPAP